MRRSVLSILTFTAALLLGGCSDALSSEEPEPEVSYVETISISKDLVAERADVKWEDIDKFVVSFGKGTQTIVRSTLERNDFKVSIATTSASENELSILGYDRSGKLIVSSQQTIDVVQGNSYQASLSPIYDHATKGSVTMFVSWKDAEIDSVSKVELVNDDDDTVIAQKDLSSSTDATYLSFEGDGDATGLPVHIRLYDESGNQVGYSGTQTVKIASNLTSSYEETQVLAGSEPAYVPEPVTNLILAGATPTSLTYQFDMPSSFDSLVVDFNGDEETYPLGEVPSQLTFTDLESDTTYTLSLSVTHTHKKSSYQSESVSLTGTTLPPQLVISIDNEYLSLADGKVRFSASTNRDAELTWSSEDPSILQCVSPCEGIFTLTGYGTVTVKAEGENSSDERSFTFNDPGKGDAVVTITGATADEISVQVAENGPYVLEDTLTFTLSNLESTLSAKWYLNSSDNLVGEGESVTITSSTPGITQSRIGQAQHLLLILEEGKKRYSATIGITLP